MPVWLCSCHRYHYILYIYCITQDYFFNKINFSTTEYEIVVYLSQLLFTQLPAHASLAANITLFIIYRCTYKYRRCEWMHEPCVLRRCRNFSLSIVTKKWTYKRRFLDIFFFNHVSMSTFFDIWIININWMNLLENSIKKSEWFSALNNTHLTHTLPEHRDPLRSAN